VDIEGRRMGVCAGPKERKVFFEGREGEGKRMMSFPPSLRCVVPLLLPSPSFSPPHHIADLPLFLSYSLSSSHHQVLHLQEPIPKPTSLPVPLLSQPLPPTLELPQLPLASFDPSFLPTSPDQQLLR